MEARITIIQTGFFMTLNIEVEDDMIIARITTMTRTSADTADCINIESYWFSTADWERDMVFLNQIIKWKDVIVESHTRRPRFESETGRRVWDVLSRILEIPRG